MERLRLQRGSLGSTSMHLPGKSASRVQRRPVICSAAASSSQTLDVKRFTRVRLKTKSECELAISFYPKFRYNAVGGGGWGTVTDQGDGKLALVFDTSVLVIPDFSYRTASMMGVPVPPPINIAIRPLRLEGTLDKNTGEVNLNFDADFYFTVGPIYQAPALQVRTVLTTETTQGRALSATGRRLVNNGGLLVGTATVPRVQDLLMDNFLQLPNDALAVMKCEFEFE